MGHEVEVTGRLKFSKPLTPDELAELQKLCGSDLWKKGYDTDSRFLDLTPTLELDALMHDGSEKSYEVDQQVRILLKEMRERFPGFKLEGKLEVCDEMSGEYLVTAEGEKDYDTGY